MAQKGVQLAELPDRNPLYPTFSNAVKIEYEEGRGRFAVAKREVKVGELLASRLPPTVADIRTHQPPTSDHCFEFTRVQAPPSNK